ncbi:hypothetical protein [Streptomyces axinellae]|uniref:Uncharacterized protein n=1 Tax=Streptomyces axinellae TaxID=552788 RepID=A0ABP6DA54_9ACTN
MRGRCPRPALLRTALHTGCVFFTVELHEAEPPLDADRWEEIVEVSFRPGGGEPALVEWAGEGACPLGLDRVPYRVRCAARGMDAAHDGARGRDEPVLDTYPAPPPPPEIRHLLSR